MEKDVDTKLERQKMFDSITQITGDASKLFSDICRQIVFALIVVGWGLYNVGNSPIQTSYLTGFFLLLIAYLFIDILQYWSIAILYRIHHNRMVAKIRQKKEGESIELIDKRVRTRINNVSFSFFIAKSILLILIFITVIVVFWKMFYNVNINK